MKIAMLILLFSFSAMAANDVSNSNNTIIVKPEITVKTGCCADSCKKQKTKTIVKTVIQKVEVEKQVLVPVEVQKVVYVDRPVVVERRIKVATPVPSPSGAPVPKAPRKPRSACHGYGEAPCKAVVSCAWISGASRSNGTRVAPYCRAKPA